MTINGNGAYETPIGYAPSQVGTYQWTASYSGDSNNNSAATTCGEEAVVFTG